MRYLTSLICFLFCADTALSQDRIEMKNGDVLSGQVRLTEVSIITMYGAISVPRDFVHTYNPEGGAQQTAALRTFGGDTFSGFLAQPSVPIDLQDGSPLTIRKETIGRVVLEQAQDVTSAPTNISAEMRNGDKFAAKINHDMIQISASYGTLSIAVEDIRRIEFEGETRVVARVELRNGDIRQGRLDTEDFALSLPWNGEIVVFRDKFSMLDFGERAQNLADLSQASPHSIVVGAGEAVNEDYALVVRKSGSGQVSTSATVFVNDEKVGVFLNDRVVPLRQYLRKGLNSIVIDLQPLAGVQGTEHLSFRAGPQSGSSFAPEWHFDTGSIDTQTGGSHSFYYFAIDKNDRAEVGDVAIFSRPHDPRSPVPLYTDVIIDDRVIARLTGTTHGVPMAGIAENAVHNVRFVTKSYQNIRSENWLNIEVGRVASIERETYRYAPLVEFSSREGWDFSEKGVPSAIDMTTTGVRFDFPFTY